MAETTRAKADPFQRRIHCSGFTETGVQELAIFPVADLTGTVTECVFGNYLSPAPKDPRPAY